MMPSPKAQEDADTMLRRLRNDVNAFQNPQVRNALMNIDSTRVESLRGTVPMLEAQLIALRTSLTAATEKFSKLERRSSVIRSELEEERERTEALKASLKTVEHERATFESRVVELERDHLTATKSASENAALLSMSSMAASQRVAQLESDLEHARAAVLRAESERNSAKASLDTRTRDYIYQRDTFKDESSTRLEKIMELEALITELREERKRDTAEMEANLANLTRRADAATAEVAELRGQCANRVEEARLIRVECAAKQAEVTVLRSKLKEHEKDMHSLSKLRKEIKKGMNATELVDALREEKEMLKGLIGSLAPSGLPSDGLKILRDSALKKTLSKGASGTDTKGVSSKELEGISSRLIQYGKDVEEARIQANEARVARDAAVAEAERNKRLKEKAEEELEVLRSTMSTNVSSPKVKKFERARTDEYKRIMDELASTIHEKEAELLKVTNKVTPSETLQRDLIRLLESQLKETERERDEALVGKNSLKGRLGVKDGRVGKAKDGGSKRGRGKCR